MMGALTLKTYSYKSRPWELRSKDTISLKDPFFPVIRVFLSQQKILRILPVVGEEEWLSDGSRFFESQVLNTSCLMKVDCRSEFLIEKKHLIEINTYHRKLSLEKTLDYFQKDIKKKEELTIILGANTPINTLSSLREFGKLENTLKITVVNPFGYQEINNPVLTMDDLKNHCIFLMTSIHEISPLLEVQLNDFVDEGGELYSFNVKEEPNNEISLLGNSFKTLQKVLSGHVLTKLPPLFIIPTYLKDIIPAQFKTFVLGVPLNNYYFNYKKTWQTSVSPNTVLNLDTNLRASKNATTTSYLLSPSTSNLKYNDFFIPVTAFWNDYRKYKTMFKSFVTSYPVLLFKNSVYTTKDILYAIKSALTNNGV